MLHPWIRLSAASLIAAVLTMTAYSQGERFEKPVELSAANKPLTGILYPSPVIHDIDKNGEADLVIGDIFGAVRIAKAERGEITFGAIKKAQAQGKELKLNNW